MYEKSRRSFECTTASRWSSPWSRGRRANNRRGLCPGERGGNATVSCRTSAASGCGPSVGCRGTAVGGRYTTSAVACCGDAPCRGTTGSFTTKRGCTTTCRGAAAARRCHRVNSIVRRALRLDNDLVCCSSVASLGRVVVVVSWWSRGGAVRERGVCFCTHDGVGRGLARRGVSAHTRGRRSRGTHRAEVRFGAPTDAEVGRSVVQDELRVELQNAGGGHVAASCLEWAGFSSRCDVTLTGKHCCVSARI